MDEDTYVITGKPLRPHEYVIVKREMTAADEAYVQNHGMTGSGSKKNPQVHVLMGDARLALVRRMVLRWNLTRTVRGPDGSETEAPIELSDKAIENLPRRLFNFIHQTIDRLNADEEEETDEDFLPAANGHSASAGSSLSLVRNTPENG